MISILVTGDRNFGLRTSSARRINFSWYERLARCYQMALGNIWRINHG